MVAAEGLQIIFLFRRGIKYSFFRVQPRCCLRPCLWRKPVVGPKVTCSADSTLVNIYMRKKLTPLPKPTALAQALIVLNSAHTCSDSFILTEVTQLGKPNILLFTWRKVGLARWVTLLAKSTFCFPCLPHFVRKWMKSWWVTHLPGNFFT